MLFVCSVTLVLQALAAGKAGGVSLAAMNVGKARGLAGVGQGTIGNGRGAAVLRSRRSVARLARAIHRSSTQHTAREARADILASQLDFISQALACRSHAAAFRATQTFSQPSDPWLRDDKLPWFLRF